MGRAVSRSVSTIAILGFGEVGSALATALRKQDGGLRIAALDTRVDSLQAKAKALDVTLHGTPGPWLGEADAVFSAVTGEQAVAVATSVSAHLADCAIYIDLNTAPKETMTSVATAVEPSGAAFVDTAIMGVIGPHAFPSMLMAGPAAEEACAWMTGLSFRIKTITGEAGNASAVKMMRSVFVKGLEALTVETFTAAEHYGLTRVLIDNLSDLDEIPLASTINSMITKHIQHAVRRCDEVMSAEAILRKDRFDAVMTTATKAVFVRTVAAKRAGRVKSAEDDPNFSQSLNLLLGLTRDTKG